MLAARSARTLAITLLLIEGLSGASVGATLLGGFLGFPTIGGAIAIPLGILGYGLVLVIGAVGLIRRRAWGWLIAVVGILAGLASLAVLLAIAGWDDAVLLGGVAIWGITVGAILAGRNAPK
jgi:hypothetical protein